MKAHPKVIRSLIVLLAAAVVPISAAQAGGSGSLQRDTDQLVRSVQTGLTLQGKWPPPVGSPEMQLCTALQAFTQEVKRAPNSSNNNQYQNGQFGNPQFAGLQASAANVDSLIGLASNSPDVASRWMSIKNQIGSFGGNPYANPYGNTYANPYYQGSVNQAGFNPAFNNGFNP